MKTKFFRRGISRLMGSLIFFFIGPVIITQAARNENHKMFTIVFIVGIIFMIMAIIFAYLGIRNIFKAIDN